MNIVIFHGEADRHTYMTLLSLLPPLIPSDDFGRVDRGRRRRRRTSEGRTPPPPFPFHFVYVSVCVGVKERTKGCVRDGQRFRHFPVGSPASLGISAGPLTLGNFSSFPFLFVLDF